MLCVTHRIGFAALASAVTLIWPVQAKESASPPPDFSGFWARMTFGAEPPPSGPGPLVNLMHLP